MKQYLYPLIGIVVWVILAALILMYAPRTNERRIDCSLAEFHPDYTPEMRKQCRLIRSSRLL